jgi:hypothetical protein
MVTNLDVLVLLWGNPIDEYQSLVLFIVAGILTVIEVMYFLFVFKLIAGWFSPKL